jgi:hypothetical protein
MIDYSKFALSKDFQLRGVVVRVSAAPYGLVKAVMVADTDAGRADASAEIVRACCTVEGAAIDPDRLSAQDIATLARESMSVEESAQSDFSTPPAVAGSGG